jgi:hypothetical protein
MSINVAALDQAVREQRAFLDTFVRAHQKHGPQGVEHWMDVARYLGTPRGPMSVYVVAVGALYRRIIAERMAA